MPHLLAQHIGKYVFCICFFSWLGMARSVAQEVPRPDSTQTNSPSTLRVDSTASDSLEMDPAELQPPSRISNGVPPDAPPGSEMETLNQQLDTSVPDAIQFQSDSLTLDFKGGRMATLFGNAKVSHPSGTLASGEITMDLNTSIVEATALSDEDTLSMPLLSRDDEQIRSRRILFNYKTKKGKFEEARINVGEGQLIGSKIKNVSETEVFIENGKYSTCPPEYLYYYIQAEKMKVVDEDEIFFTNARLYILDIPYPLIFPFGYVPSGGIEKKKSGLLTPTYVFDAKAQYGIGLNNVGWFQYINDYLTSTLSANIYTSGTYTLNNTTQYRKGDLYSGSVSIGYSRKQGLEPTDPGFSKTVEKSIYMKHSQTISPFANISANINLRTENFLTQTSYNIDDRSQTSTRSNANYSYRHPDNLFNFSTNASFSQDFYNNITTLQGPNATFTLNSISPFQKSGGTSSNWYESITLRYSNKLGTNFRYAPIDADSATISFWEALTNRSLYEEATGSIEYIQTGLLHTGSVGVGKLLNSEYLNASASISFNEYWYPSSIRKNYNSETNSVETHKIGGFAAARSFTTALSFSTTLYGISTAKIANFEGFRHTFTPTISFGYHPDFSTDLWGYYRTVQSDSLGNTQKYSIFEKELYGGPSAGESRSISLSIRNVFETKIINRDSTGEINERVLKLIDNLSLNTSYNFAADSLNLSQLSAQISSKAITGLNLSANATFSFYQRNESGTLINRFVWEQGRLAQPERITLSASTSFRGGKQGIVPYTPVYKRVYDPLNQSIFHTIDPGYGYEPIAPVNSTWSFGLNFSYQWLYRFGEKPSRSATLNITSISFNLTPKWKFSINRLGYDFMLHEITPGQFNLNRNLECWDLSFQISPFGENQFYFFRLSLNSAQIQSLFQKLPILRNLERRSDGLVTGSSSLSDFSGLSF